MELKFTIKIKDEQNPPIFNKELGKGVLSTVIVEFIGATEKDFESNPQLSRQINELIENFKNDWIEVLIDKI